MSISSENTEKLRSGASALDVQPVKLRILDKDVQLSCRPGDEDDLMKAAAYVDKSMRELRQRNATSGIEKIAIVTAINTANELLKARSQQGESSSLITRMATLNKRVTELLAEDADAPDSTNS